MLHEAWGVMEARGFTYKTVVFVWIKRNRQSDGIDWGMGYWTRAHAEICLLATRGHPKRQAKNVHQVIISHVEGHSKKDGQVPILFRIPTVYRSTFKMYSPCSLM